MTEPSSTTQYQSAMFNLAELVDDPRTGLERCESPRRAIPDLLDNLPFHVEGRILEACSGNGMLTHPLRERGYEVVANDYDPRVEADLHFDARDPRLAPAGTFDYAITNPPFSLAQAILENLLPAVRVGCLFLLRLTFGEPTLSRNAFFQAWPPTGQIITPRYSFYGDSSDSSTTAWFIWLKKAVPREKGAAGYQYFNPTTERIFKIAKR
jgi:SAM-dependent methyltransferase